MVPQGSFARQSHVAGVMHEAGRGLQVKLAGSPPTSELLRWQ
jgi:hypothetical protein